jgi:hypothetical protein
MGLLVSVGVGADERVFEGTSLPLEARRLAEELTTCAAYYFNATQVRPMGEYEALHAAGERAMNRALRLLDRQRVDRLIGDASVTMTAMTGGDWRHYERVTARYGADCASLIGTPD